MSDFTLLINVVTDTEVTIFKNDNSIIIAFRGTESKTDARINVRIKKYPFPYYQKGKWGKIKVHSGFLNAVDIADYLAISRGLSFRMGYKIISEAVGLAKEDCIQLNDLNSLLGKQKVKALSEKEFQNLCDPVQCLFNRNHAGSPHPERVLEHLKTINQENQNSKKWITQQRRKIHKAKLLCDTE